jgi:hypothetical protein
LISNLSFSGFKDTFFATTADSQLPRTCRHQHLQQAPDLQQFYRLADANVKRRHEPLFFGRGFFGTPDAAATGQLTW